MIIFLVFAYVTNSLEMAPVYNTVVHMYWLIFLDNDVICGLVCRTVNQLNLNIF